MKKSNKILAVVLALVMMLTAVPMMTAGATETEPEAPAHVHAFEKTAEVKADCKTETNGSATYTCECGLAYTVPTDEYEHELIGSVKQNDEATHKQRCDKCEADVETPHTFVETVTKAPTCNEEGKKDIKCSVCGYEEKDITVAKVPHTFTTIASGDIDDEKHIGVCTVCNETVEENHIWGEGVVTTAPKCAATGVMKYTCTVCNKDKEATSLEEINAIVNDTEKAAADWAKINFTHSYSEWKANETNGMHTRKCTICGGDETSEAHKYVVVVGETSKCDKTVALTVTCEDCDYKLEAKATEHNFGAFEQYDEAGHKQTCQNGCNLTVVAPHNWEDVKELEAATCGKVGSKEVKCKDCGKTATVEIPMLAEHTWNAGVETTPATCGAKGVKTFTCTVCNATRTEEIPMVGEHTWGEWKVTREPNILWKGEETRECSVCGAKETREYVKPENPDEPEYKVGDVNGDNTVGAVDARMILRYVADLIELSEDELARADVDGNGQVQAVDARKILRMLVEQE